MATPRRTPRNRGKFSKAMDEYFAQLRAEMHETVAAQALQQCDLWCDRGEDGYIIHSDTCLRRHKK